MLRLVRYELKAMARYSSGVKRRRLSLVLLAVAPAVIVFNIRIAVRYLGTEALSEIFESYPLLTLILLSNIALGGSMAISIGRVSNKASELIYSSAIKNSELFRSLYLVVLVNVAPLLAPEAYLAFVLLGFLGGIVYLALAILSTLIGYGFIASVKSYKQAIAPLALIGLAALVAYLFPRTVRPLEELYRLEVSTIGLAEASLMIFLAIAAVPYGISHARGLIVREEAVIKAGKLGRGALGVLKVHLIRVPALLFFLALMGFIAAFNAYTTSGAEIVLVITSTASTVAIVMPLILIYMLSRELGRKDLRLASPNEKLPFRTRLSFALLGTLIYSLGATLFAVWRFPEATLRAFIRSLSLTLLPLAVATYYASGACRPVKGSLRDAFRAPIAKQVFVLIIISMAIYFIVTPLMAATYERSLDILTGIGLIAISYPIFKASEKRFLERARRVR